MSRRNNVTLHPNLIKSEQLTCNASILCYKKDILDLYSTLQNDSNNLINPIMIDNQPEIKWTMRPYLIDFLIELHIFFDLSPEALFLASSIADRYCSKRIVYKRHYQLLVATSLWIAAKYQDKKSRVPTLKELYLLCYQIYDPQMFVQMERHILTTLEWSVGNIFSVNECLNVIFDQSTLLCKDTIPGDEKLFQMTSFILDLSLYQRGYLLFNSSTRTIAALLLASSILNQTIFSDYIKLIIDTNKISNNNNSSKKQNQQTKLNFPFKYIAGDKNNNNDDNNLSLDLMINDENLNDIRKCLLLYLNDIFKEKSMLMKSSNNSNQSAEKYKISKVLFKKYSNLPIQKYLQTFIAKRLELYIHLQNLMETRDIMKKNGTFIQPWVQNSINMFIDYFASLQDIRYDDEDIINMNHNSNINNNNNNNNLNSNIVTCSPDAIHLSQQIRVQSPIDLAISTPQINRFSTSSTPVSLRSTSSLSEVSSRNSSIFSQPSFRGESPNFIDTITPTSATLPGMPSFNNINNNVNQYTKPRSKTVNAASYLHYKSSGLNLNNINIACSRQPPSSIPPTPSFGKHKNNASFSSIGPSNLFSIDQSPVIASGKDNNNDDDDDNISIINQTNNKPNNDFFTTDNWNSDENIMNSVDPILTKYNNAKFHFKQNSKSPHSSINGILDLNQVALQTSE
ncbi:hypothetical protein MOSE0_J08438 [Monosporozyma servazzii]